MEALTETGSAPDAGGGTPRIFLRAGAYIQKNLHHAWKLCKAKQRAALRP